MAVKIGAIIKKLRLKNGITQETLANAIGVTPQAVSRWEGGGGYPDMGLLPALADFFAVSTDELLGYKQSEREEELAEIKKEMERLSEVGTVEEQLAFARNANAKYPTDCAVKKNLADCLFALWGETHELHLFAEMERLFSYVIAESDDAELRYDAIILLLLAYGQSNKPEKAKALAELLPPLKHRRESALAYGIGDERTEFYKQDEIDKLTDALGLAIRNYALDAALPNDSTTWDRRIEMLNVSNRLYFLIYGEDLLFYHIRIAYNCFFLSTYQLAQGKTEDALESLEEMSRHAVAYDESFLRDHGRAFTSILTDTLFYPKPGEDFHECTAHTTCYDMLERLAGDRYDPLRENPRFQAVVDTMQNHVK